MLETRGPPNSGKQPLWGKTRQHLLQDGTISRYRLGTSVRRETRPNTSKRQQAAQKVSQQYQQQYQTDQSRLPFGSGTILNVPGPGVIAEQSSRPQRPVAKEQDSHEARVAEEFSIVPLHLLRTVLDTHRREVFASYPRHVEGPELEVLDEYINIMLRDEIPFKIVSGVRAVTVSWFLPQAIRDRRLFDCSMATARGMFESRRTPPPFRPSAMVFAARGRAIKAVQSLVSQQEAYKDDRALIGVMQLMGTHIITGDMPSFQSHHKAVTRMIELRGGLGNSDAHRALRGFLGMNEMFALMLKYVMTMGPASAPSPTDRFMQSSSAAAAAAAPKTALPPVIPGSTLQRSDPLPPPAPAIPQQNLDYPRQLFPEALNHLISGLPPGFSDLALTGTLSMRTIHLLAQTTSWAKITSTSNPSASVSQSDIFRLYSEPMESAKIALSILFALPSLSVDPRLEHLLCLGLCLSIRGARNQARPPALHIRLLSDFIACAKSLSTRPLSQPEEDCLVWISFLAAYGSGHRAFQRQVDGLVDLVVCRYLDSVGRDWMAWEALLRKFLWFEPLGVDWAELWRGSVSRLSSKLGGIV